jgi:hypothetical protein
MPALNDIRLRPYASRNRSSAMEFRHLVFIL